MLDKCQATLMTFLNTHKVNSMLDYDMLDIGTLDITASLFMQHDLEGSKLDQVVATVCTSYRYLKKMLKFCYAPTTSAAYSKGFYCSNH